jgi:hypothetical protein
VKALQKDRQPYDQTQLTSHEKVNEMNIFWSADRRSAPMGGAPDVTLTGVFMSKTILAVKDRLKSNQFFDLTIPLINYSN